MIAGNDTQASVASELPGRAVKAQVSWAQTKFLILPSDRGRTGD